METIDLGGPSVVDRIGYRLLAGLDQREFIEYLFLNHVSDRLRTSQGNQCALRDRQ